MKKNYLKFWGTRGSCPVSGPQYAQFGGNTSCVEVRYGDTFFIIDAGTGIRGLGDQLQKEKKIDLFFSHMHWDHLIGLPFFAPLFRSEVEVHIWSAEGEGRTIHDLIKEVLAKEFFPVPLEEIEAHLHFHNIETKKPLKLGPLTLDFYPTHHPSTTLSFKIKTPHQTISYTSDNEIELPLQQGFISFHRHSDYFIHEAQYSPEEYKMRRGWGHSCLSRAIELVREVDPSHWLVIHHDPSHTDQKLKELEKFARAQSLPCPVDWIGDDYLLPLK